MIYTSYFGNIGKLKNAGIIPVNIAQYQPSWFRGDSIKELAPSPSLFRELKDKMITEKEFNRRYFNQINKLNKNEILNKINQIGEEVALLCYEKNIDECHRKIAGEWLGAKEWTSVKIQTKLF